MKKQIIGMMALALILGGCSFQSTELSEETTVPTENISVESEAGSEAKEDKTEDSTADVGGEVAAQNSEDSENKESAELVVDSEKPSGTYSRTFTEEIGGTEVECVDSYTFNDDGTGESSRQDTVSFTWDSKHINMDYGDTYEYEFDGEVLKVKEQFGWEEYTKQ